MSISSDTDGRVRFPGPGRAPHDSNLVVDTHERPFPCPHCGKNFPRADVRAKHMQRSHGPAPPSLSTTTTTATATETETLGGRERAKLACDECRKRKLKCDNSHPCRNCRLKNRQCQVSDASRPPGRPRRATSEPSNDLTDHAGADAFELSAASIAWNINNLNSTDSRMGLMEEISHPAASQSTFPLLSFDQAEMSTQLQQQPPPDPGQRGSIADDPIESLSSHMNGAVDPTWEVNIDLLEDLYQLPPLVSLAT